MIMNLSEFNKLNSGIIVDATLVKTKAGSYDLKKSLVAVVSPNEPLKVTTDNLIYEVIPPDSIYSQIVNCCHFKSPRYFVKQEDGSYMIAYKKMFKQSLTDTFKIFMESYMNWYNQKRGV